MSERSQQAVVELLREVTGEDAEWVAGIGPDTRVDGDLFVDSIELLALSARLAERFGPAVDLAGHIAGLDLDALLRLTIADVTSYVDSTGSTT